MSSRLVVLGSCGAWPEGGRACSGLLLEHDGFRLALDLGYATLPRLLSVLGSPVADGLDAVIVTHRHADHALDLHGLFRARWFGRPGAAALPLYSPVDVVDQVGALEADHASAVREVFDWHPLPSDAYRVGPFRLESMALPHYVPNAGVRLCAPGLTVAYTGDTGPVEELAELGADADLYVMAASDPQPPSASALEGGPQLLLSAHDAGRAATAARARRLLLTHFRPGSDRELNRAAAGAVFSGEVILADEDLSITLP
jgi:ribonuclease BN (tRNA processing enzyme)